VTRYHVNGKGNVAVCRAAVGNCPLGDNSQHIEASNAIEANFINAERLKALYEKANNTLKSKIMEWEKPDWNNKSVEERYFSLSHIEESIFNSTTLDDETKVQFTHKLDEARGQFFNEVLSEADSSKLDSYIDKFKKMSGRDVFFLNNNLSYSSFVKLSDTFIIGTAQASVYSRMKSNARTKEYIDSKEQIDDLLALNNLTKSRISSTKVRDVLHVLDRNPEVIYSLPDKTEGLRMFLILDSDHSLPYLKDFANKEDYETAAFFGSRQAKIFVVDKVSDDTLKSMTNDNDSAVSSVAIRESKIRINK